MPVRSLTSSVLRWPDAHRVRQALQAWATAVAHEHADVLQIGYFGSYARGDWGVGSDLDVVVVVARAEQPFWSRSCVFDLSALVVPADVLVYTRAEWAAGQSPFLERLRREVVWVFSKDEERTQKAEEAWSSEA